MNNIEFWLIYNQEYHEFWCDENGWNTLDKRPAVFKTEEDATETINDMFSGSDFASIVPIKFCYNVVNR